MFKLNIMLLKNLSLEKRIRLHFPSPLLFGIFNKFVMYTLHTNYYIMLFTLLLSTVYKSPEYDLLAYDMAIERLIQIGYPSVSDTLYT